MSEPDAPSQVSDARGGDDSRYPMRSPESVAAELAATGYLADTGLATACFLAATLERPLFLEGAPGVGKTSLAHALAQITDAPLVRLQCYEGIDASQALYDWDFPKQLLHLRSVEAAGDGRDADTLEKELWGREFLIARPLLQALETTPSVLLIDEIDRADDEFEAFLLEVLSDWTVTVPELGTIRAEVPPLVVLTSNRTREVHDALKRRCFYHWIDHPSFDEEVAIVRSRLPDVAASLAGEVAAVASELRSMELLKPPGVAETLDWTRALVAVGATTVTAEAATATLGAMIKYHEDVRRVEGMDVGMLVQRAVMGT